ncbi:hypothetical protein, partial [Frankia casuarinae]
MSDFNPLDLSLDLPLVLLSNRG